MSNASIGIIGGADGPTQIIISGNPLPELLAVIAVVAVIVGVIVYLKRRK